MILIRGPASRVAALCNGKTTGLPSLCLTDPAPRTAEELAAGSDVFPFRVCCEEGHTSSSSARVERTGRRDSLEWRAPAEAPFDDHARGRDSSRIAV